MNQRENWALLVERNSGAPRTLHPLLTNYLHYVNTDRPRRAAELLELLKAERARMQQHLDEFPGLLKYYVTARQR